MNICMAVFDVAQHVIAQSAGLINGSTAIDASTLAAMQTTLESKGVGELIGIFFQTSIIFTLMGILSALIFVIVYARMIEIYQSVWHQSHLQDVFIWLPFLLRSVSSCLL